MLYTRVPRGQFTFSCSDTCSVRRYRLATMHSITDRQTDNSMMPMANHTAHNSTIGKKIKAKLF